MITKIKTSEEITWMRESGRMLATVLEHACRSCEVGMTTKELANIAAAEINKLGGEPAFLGYYGFPDVICISVNDEVVHGIPGKYVIKDGDIVSPRHWRKGWDSTQGSSPAMQTHPTRSARGFRPQTPEARHEASAQPGGRRCSTE